MRYLILTLTLFMLGITAPADAQDKSGQTKGENQVSVLARYADKADSMAKGELINNDGDKIGRIALWQGTKGVVVDIKAQNLPAGRHGMHFHAVGDCSDMAKFKSAGGHVMAESRPHGFFHEDGPHDGNLPNLIVGSDGTAHVELYTDMVTLNGYTAPLLDENGSTLIVHTNGDDHHSQPIGGSGARIACAEIEPATL